MKIESTKGDFLRPSSFDLNMEPTLTSKSDRFKTRMDFVQESEHKLEQKKEHCEYFANHPHNMKKKSLLLKVFQIRVSLKPSRARWPYYETNEEFTSHELDEKSLILTLRNRVPVTRPSKVQQPSLKITLISITQSAILVLTDFTGDITCTHGLCNSPSCHRTW